MPLMLKRIRSTRTPRQKRGHQLCESSGGNATVNVTALPLAATGRQAGVRVKADILFPNAAANTNQAILR
jgi:hypothetical protein